MTCATPLQVWRSCRARDCRWSESCLVIDGTGRPPATHTLPILTLSERQRRSGPLLQRRWQKIPKLPALGNFLEEPPRQQYGRADYANNRQCTRLGLAVFALRAAAFIEFVIP